MVHRSGSTQPDALAKSLGVRKKQQDRAVGKVRQIIESAEGTIAIRRSCMLRRDPGNFGRSCSTPTPKAAEVALCFLELQLRRRGHYSTPMRSKSRGLSLLPRRASGNASCCVGSRGLRSRGDDPHLLTPSQTSKSIGDPRKAQVPPSDDQNKSGSEHMIGKDILGKQLAGPHEPGKVQSKNRSELPLQTSEEPT